MNGAPGLSGSGRLEMILLFCVIRLCSMSPDLHELPPSKETEKNQKKARDIADQLLGASEHFCEPQLVFNRNFGSSVGHGARFVLAQEDQQQFTSRDRT